MMTLPNLDDQEGHKQKPASHWEENLDTYLMPRRHDIKTQKEI